MTAVLADTFYWVALTDDALYEQAARAESQMVDVPVVTTDEVLAEFLTFFSNSLRLRGSAVETVRELARDPNLRILPQSRETFQAGFDLYAARPDKGYSLTDCISMQTMKRLGLTDVLTNDRRFDQEGFKALLRL
jgi:predicted nucleic acid-binding protein